VIIAQVQFAGDVDLDYLCTSVLYVIQPASGRSIIENSELWEYIPHAHRHDWRTLQIVSRSVYRLYKIHKRAIGMESLICCI